MLMKKLVLLFLSFIPLLLTAQPVKDSKQFTLFDVVFTYTKENADNSTPSKSHYYVKGDKINPERPKDWTHRLTTGMAPYTSAWRSWKSLRARHPQPGAYAISPTKDRVMDMVVRIQGFTRMWEYMKKMYP